MKSEFLGFGLGVRTQHIPELLSNESCVDWVEILTENFMVDGGKPRYFLHQMREKFPMVMHGVSLSIGSAEPLNSTYLSSLKSLIDDVNPKWFSDHLCWTGINSTNTHDLLPLPYDEDVVRYIGDRIRQVQDIMEKPFLIENVSSYLTFKQSSMTEWEFLSEIVSYADCGILLDINNIYVSARNHGFSPSDYLKGIDPRRVQQFHLAGHSDYGDYVIDTHDQAVSDSVWSLYADAIKRFGATSTMIERDDNIPELPVLLDELEYAKHIARECLPDFFNPSKTA